MSISEAASKARHIPDEMIPFCEQSLLNLALNGVILVTNDGGDLTSSLLSKSDEINANYAKALNKLRKKTPRPERTVTRKKPTPKSPEDQLTP